MAHDDDDDAARIRRDDQEWELRRRERMQAMTNSNRVRWDDLSDEERDAARARWSKERAGLRYDHDDGDPVAVVRGALSAQGTHSSISHRFDRFALACAADPGAAAMEMARRTMDMARWVGLDGESHEAHFAAALAEVRAAQP